MKISLSRGKIAIIVLVLVLAIDQIIKIWVKTNMYWHESIRITDWFFIYFTENPGMAFGMEIFSKLFLSLFRIIAVSVIGWYLVKIIREKFKTGYVVCVSLILAGAMGNIIDSIFYGVIFEASNPITHNLANFVPIGEGYSSWFHGKVVDMFYFPIIQSTWPLWVPKFGGEEFIFFSPIFNFADAAISCGMIALIIFYGKYLSSMYNSDKKVKFEEKK
jgi:Lipoprotein signal peptidase